MKVVFAELAAGLAVVVILFGLSYGYFGFLNLPEATGFWLVLFLILLVIIDIFLIVYTLTSWERE